MQRNAAVLRRLAIATVTFVAMTVVMTAPFSWQFTDHLVPHNDSYSHIWKLAWIAHALKREPLEVFNANHFAPAPHTLVYSDPMPLLALLAAPFIWAGLHPVAVHNALVLLSYVTAGLGMFVLAFELTGTMVPSLLAGTIFTFASQRFGHISRIEILWVCWMPLAMWALYRLMKNGRLRDGACLGAFVALQGLTCLYHFAFLGTYLGIAGLASIDRAPLESGNAASPDWRSPRRRRPSRRSLFCGLRSDANRGAFEIGRHRQAVQRYDSDLRSRPAREPVVRFLRRTADARERSLFPGALAIALAAVGIWKGPRRLVLVYATGMVFALLMSFGVNGWLFPIVRSVVPPLEEIRAPARYGILVLMSLAALAAVGASRILAVQGRRFLISAVFFLVLVVEYASMPILVSKAVLEPPAMARWLADQPRRVMLTLPILWWRYDSFYQFLSIYHWQPMLNGYTAFIPPAYSETTKLLETFPDATSIQRLRDLNVAYVVLSAKDYGEPRYSELVQQLRARTDFEESVVLRTWFFRQPFLPCAADVSLACQAAGLSD